MVTNFFHFKKVKSFIFVMVVFIISGLFSIFSNNRVSGNINPQSSEKSVINDNVEYRTIEKGVLKIGTNATLSPFEYVDGNGQIIGFDIDLIKKIGEKLKLKVEIIDMDFDAIIPALNTKIDLGVAAISETEERKKQVNFSVPYYSTNQEIIVKENSKPEKKIEEEHNLKGKIIAAQLGSTGNECGQKIADKYKEDNTELRTYATYLDMVEDLLKDRLDAIIMDKDTAQKFNRLHKGKLKILDRKKFGFEEEKYSIVRPKMEKEEQDDALLKAINLEIEKLINSAEYRELLDKYINVSETELGQKEQTKTNLIDPKICKQYLSGLLKSLEITLFAAVIGLILGIILALLKLTKNKKNKPTIKSRIASLYIDLIRGTPVILQLLILWSIINIKSNIIVAIIAFGLNSSAYVAEIMRGNILAVDKGQTEAGISMGFNKLQTVFYIVLPQGIKNALPPLCNEFISLLKETSIVGIIAVCDLARVAQQISTSTYQKYGPHLIAAGLYFIIAKTATIFLSKLEKKLRKNQN